MKIHSIFVNINGEGGEVGFYCLFKHRRLFSSILVTVPIVSARRAEPSFVQRFVM